MNSKEKYKNLPLEMKNMKRFVGWKKGSRKDKNGHTLITKLPYSLVDNSGKNWNDVDRWVSFNEAIRKSQDLGFVLKRDDQITAIDLDNCFEGGKLKPFAKGVVKTFEGSYTELSQSGEGIHIFVKGSVPENINIRKLGIEIYTENHYIALTGNTKSGAFRESNLILDRNLELNKLYSRLKSKPEKDIRHMSTPSVPISNSTVPSNGDEILDTMAKTNSKAGTLISGGSLTGDHSRDDYIFLSLARNYTHGNSGLMKEIFLKTGLNRMGTGEKRRSDAKYLEYLDRTIDSVLRASYRPFDWTDHNAYMERQKRKQVRAYDRV